MEWQHRLWQEVTPHLPHGRVGVWAPPKAFPLRLAAPANTLLEYHNLNHPAPPHGTALAGALVLGCGTPPVAWAAWLAQVKPLLAPHAPLLLLVPRTGLVKLPEAFWASADNDHGWQRTLKAAGWHIQAKFLLGGAYKLNPWATAACRLYNCTPHGGIAPTKVQFNRKVSGTASATGCGA